jgi:hypothetical protein
MALKPMSRKTPGSKRPVEQYDHKAKKRGNKELEFGGSNLLKPKDVRFELSRRASSAFPRVAHESAQSHTSEATK